MGTAVKLPAASVRPLPKIPTFEAKKGSIFVEHELYGSQLRLEHTAKNGQARCCIPIAQVLTMLAYTVKILMLANAMHPKH
ncbi:MAG: hypothetical protein NZ781_10415 [Armatimonadetes bacterium]|nr:hypothetical protein [Armatimonadota bacterium]